jgi:hypothetical protein
MARILIGSSNIRRFYPCDQTKEYPNYKIEAATLKRAFELTIEAIPNDAKVIISVLENFIEKEVNLVEREKKAETMKKVVQSVVAVVVASARKNKKARFALAYPIRRPNNSWMTEHEEDIKKEFEMAVNTQCEMNINKIDAISWGSQEFESDGVHLNKSAGNSFVGNLVGMAEESFKAEQVDMEEEDQISKVLNLGKSSTAAYKAAGLVDFKKVSNEINSWRHNLERNLNDRFRSDNLMFARLRDEMDTETNKKREDRTQVTGLVDATLIPKPTNERNEFLRKTAFDFCVSVKEDFDGEILFASASGNPTRGKLMLEFRVDKVEKAREIRKAFAVKKASNSLPDGMESIQVLTVITLATKIRIDLMKAIARRIESDSESAYVPSFLPRPILHIKAKSRGDHSRGEKGDPKKHLSSLTFADAIKEYGGLIRDNDLAPAYKRAGINFRGQMRQHFVVLEDLEEHRPRFAFPPPTRTEKAPDTAPGTSGSRGTKRTADSGSDRETEGCNKRTK